MRHSDKLIVARRSDLLWLIAMGKILFTTITILYAFFFSGCTRVVTLPVRTVVDWTEEKEISSESVHDLSIGTAK